MITPIHAKNGLQSAAAGTTESNSPFAATSLQALADRLPIAPGFIIEVKEELLHSKPLFRRNIASAVAHLEAETERKLNSVSKPLFLRISEFSVISGELRTIVDLVGTTPKLIGGLIDSADADEQTAYFAFNRYVKNYCIAVMNRKESEFDGSTSNGSTAKMRNEKYLSTICPTFPKEPLRQIEIALIHIIKSQTGSQESANFTTALIVQASFCRELQPNIRWKHLSTRSPISGEKELDTVSLLPLEDRHIAQIQSAMLELECVFLDICTAEFVIDDKDALFVLGQKRVEDRTLRARMRLLCDLAFQKRLTDTQLLNAVSPMEIQGLLLPTVNPKATQELPAVHGGMSGSPGTACGRVFFSTPSLIRAYWDAHAEQRNKDLLLLKRATYAEDVQALEIGKGVITSEGGYSSHAPVVARCLGKPALLYDDIEYDEDYAVIGGHRIQEGQYIAFDANEGKVPTIYFGRIELEEPDIENPDLQYLITTAKSSIGAVKVLANGDTPHEIKTALKLGAEGVGLCRTEHMMLKEDRISIFRSLLLSDNKEERSALLAKIRPFLKSDFVDMFCIMPGFPITIRLLDAPLHEFIPNSDQELEKFRQYLERLGNEIDLAELRKKFNRIREVNPMLGHRGCRVGISSPEIYDMQVSAILEAALETYEANKKGVRLNILIPFVMSSQEFQNIRYGRQQKLSEMKGVLGVVREMLGKKGLKKMPFDFKIGAMIELPAAAVCAAEFAKHADFFSIGTNDLTQTILGISRDDINSFLSAYTKMDVLESDPFQKLTEPVRILISSAISEGRLIRPDLETTICGEHTKDTADIEFYLTQNISHLSCSPSRIPRTIFSVVLARLKNNEVPPRP